MYHVFEYTTDFNSDLKSKTSRPSTLFDRHFLLYKCIIYYYLYTILLAV